MLSFLPNDTGDNPYPQNYFAPPLKGEMYLSGNFGEIRRNHFHAGIDIKTGAREGLPVYASADGYVARINVSPYGYGNALYVRHPNGYTTVYGHLLNFIDTIQNYVREYQYRNQTFAAELYPGNLFFPVKKGQIIAYSGNTGGSGGPHLHFEIRDSQTEEPINPLLFGFPIKDTKEPVPRTLKIYPLTPKSFVNIKHLWPAGKVTQHDLTNPAVVTLKQQGSKWVLNNVDSIFARGQIGFAIESRDHHDGSWNRLGTYHVELRMNGKLLHSHKLERFAFAETRYIHSHVDYLDWKRSGRMLERSFREPGNKLRIYPRIDFDEMPELQPDSTYNFTYMLKDVNGNSSEIKFTVTGTADPAPEVATGRNEALAVFPYGQANSFRQDDFHADFLPGTFYDTVYFTYEKLPMPWKPYSALHRVHEPLTPAHRYFTVAIKPLDLPERLRSKALIVHRSNYSRASSTGGSYESGWVISRSREFGEFYIDVDTVAPQITALNIFNNADMGRKGSIRMKITDNLSGINTYNGYIDGEWVLMAYDAKYNLLYHTFETTLARGKHTYKLVVTDEKGNSDEVKYNFVY